LQAWGSVPVASGSGSVEKRKKEKKEGREGGMEEGKKEGRKGREAGNFKHHKCYIKIINIFNAYPTLRESKKNSQVP
jgi:flagellar biosynthesis/type III secretory pathway protein FliH